MRTRHSVLALALLIVLSTISGCRTTTPGTLRNPTTIEFELSPSHTPIIYVYDNQVLQFRPVSGTVTLTFDDRDAEHRLCKESSGLRGTHDAPAVCTIERQTYNDKDPNMYTLTISGSDAVQYQVYVKRCIGCP